MIFIQTWSEEIIQIQKTGLKWIIRLCKTFDRGKPGWFAILTNRNICILALLWSITEIKESIRLFIKASIKFGRKSQVLRKVSSEANSV